MSEAEGKGLNARLAFAIAAGAFGSAFQHGYNTGVLNAPQSLILGWIQSCEYAGKEASSAVSDADYELAPLDGPAADTVNAAGVSSPSVTDGGDPSVCMSDEEGILIWSFIVSAFCVGGIIGGAGIGWVSTYCGRKGGLLLNNVLMALGGVFMVAAKFASSYELLIIGRLVIGINSGLNAGIAPMYLSEIAPTAMRGAVGTVYQLIITISILLAQIMGMRNVLGNQAGWPWLLFLTVIPGVLQLVTLPFCPESPKHLLLDKDDEERAVSALMWLRGRVDVHNEIDEYKSEREAAKGIKKVTLFEMIKTSHLLKPLIIAMMMMLAQQLSGINAAIFYSTSIFKSAGLDEYKAQVATLGMGACNVAMTLVSLVLIEKAGRKTLMLTGLSVMLVTTTMILICLNVKTETFSYISIVMVILFVVGFAVGPGSIPWFFVTELFGQEARPTATAVAVVTNWSANFLVGLTFEPIKFYIGAYVFVIFIVMQLLFIIYVFFQVPETKNRTIEEITAQFRSSNSSA